MRQSIRRVGTLLRDWRRRRRLSQLDLAFEAEISPRHLSFVETGRSIPSREMVLNLAERLEVPLRERNVLLTAAGNAPTFSERSLTDPALEAARRAVELVLSGHEPYPALAIDRHWNMLASNRAIPPLLDGVSAALLTPPVNVLRLSLHPNGLASKILNFAQWRSHLIDRLQQQIDITADPILETLHQELCTYPKPQTEKVSSPALQGEYAGIVVPLQLMTPQGILSLFSTTTIFGSPLDITLSEIALESFFPGDDASAAILRDFAAPVLQQERRQ